MDYTVRNRDREGVHLVQTVLEAGGTASEGRDEAAEARGVGARTRRVALPLESDTWRRCASAWRTRVVAEEAR